MRVAIWVIGWRVSPNRPSFLVRRQVAVKLHVLTRKSLGGIQTDLESRVLKADGSVMEGLFAAGEVAGFGAGGAHGYNVLEGSFLGGCIFTGRAAGRAMA